MVSKILSKHPKFSINELTRAVWKIDCDINVTSIIRQYFIIKKRGKLIVPNKQYIKLPATLSHEKKILIRDLQDHGVALSFKNFRKYGIQATEIREIEKMNGWKASV